MHVTDHPRSRGVYNSFELAGDVYYWIIPARAGFTRRHARHRRVLADHPRSRGVYLTARVFEVVSVGSSPLARGLHRVLRLIKETRRIIPARAGFTFGGALFIL